MGNANVKSVVKLSTWKPTAGETWRENSSQNFVNEAFLVFTAPLTGDLSLNWTVGAFRNTYGPLGSMERASTTPRLSALRSASARR